ncbi:hypothetical protein QFC24_005716 [Naganishia onofrii]|uniref:Uncharacterized protein n=1 Tax=Naganishia onofrii TaxID=1851511 RepID=A0ACC2X618_9TREE|nr:hypothetical protein QFC24_005716 [Naganishia onofrii]
MSARVLLGHITWRYWKWRIRKEDSNETAPCRCQIHLEGLEWFLYNRTPSFDAIVERMQDAEKRQRDTDASGKDASMDGSSVDHSEAGEARGESETIETSGRRSTQRSEPVQTDAEPLHRPLSPPIPNIVGNITDNVRDATSSRDEKLPWQWQRDVFPFGIDISHGAVVVGNDATPTVTIAEFSTAEGVVRTEESRSRFDLFKQVVDMQFTDIQVLYRTNPDFTGALLDHGKKAYEEVMKMEPELANAPPSSLITRPAFKALAKKYRSLASQYSTKLPSYALSYYGPEKEWKGLARYRDDTDIAAALKGKEIEYAKVTTLMSTRKIEMTYFADVAGLVPEPWERADEDGHIPEDDEFELGNGDLPPQWGMDFVVYSGTMTYGPWADRQRRVPVATAFNQAFLPAIFYHTPQTERLKPGDFRKHVAMNIEVEIREATVWRMPTRESSKDWLYDKPDLPTKSADSTRKYGWLDVSIGPSSAVHYTVPLTATKFGFEAQLQLELANIKVTSSVNHTEFLSARHCLVNASMPTPLQWDARRDWTFDVNLDQVRTFLLRDHTTLIGDLAKDWNSGPTGDFDHFVPMDYQFNFSLTNFEIKLYLNDFNIINQPLTLDENGM